MSGYLFWAPILIPLAGGLIVLPMRGKSGLREAIAVIASLANLIVAVAMFGQRGTWRSDWVGHGLEMAFRQYAFSAFILAAAGAFGFLICLYCFRFMRERAHANQFFAYVLISLAMVNGAVLADHLVFLLFFWEGLLLTLFGLIALGGKGSFKTAIKALVIVGVSDLCLMFGIAMVGLSAHTLILSQIHLNVTDPFNVLAFVLMMIGAITKAGSMPFHSWIPDAAIDAPLPFMAILPASLEKLAGIYLLSRITLDIFQLTPGSWLSPLLMIIGAATILLAVMMALIQKDYKKLLSYHAISQVGYMVLGIGTAVPAGIIGGIFHMINHATYKSCLFLTGGAVEKQAGTTDLSQLGGLARKMPITFACFFVAACSISGVPPFNGFFSKELIYDGAMERNFVFYLAALAGSFLTAASFLKLGHAAYFGQRRPEHDNVKEAPASMLAPMLVLAAVCIFFGLANQVPLERLIQPSVGLQHEHFSGWPASPRLVWLTALVLLAAVINHIAGVRVYGTGVHAVDHIHYAPLLKPIYERAERRMFDPYEMGLDMAFCVGKGAWAVDRAIDWIYNRLAVGTVFVCGGVLKLMHTGNVALYVGWALAGAALVIWYVVS